MDILLFILLGAILFAVVYGLRRYWDTMVNTDPLEDAYERQMAALNERQANRFSDDQLTRPPSDDDAWRIILRRGRALMRRDTERPDTPRRRQRRPRR